MILYRGPSLFDTTAEIIVVATVGSDNRKTGPMVQLWILRIDVHPLVAVREGQDSAICGTCDMRGRGRDRSCYVTVQHAPAAVYRALRTYPDYSMLPPRLVSLKLRGQRVRVGAYGDPSAIPVEWWLAILWHAKAWTAYTSMWATADRRMADFCMASVRSVGEQTLAASMGYRTYRIRTQDALLSNEIICPASDEAGHASTCARCLLCNGTKHDGPNIAIFPHRTTVTFYRSRQGDLLL